MARDHLNFSSKGLHKQEPPEIGTTYKGSLSQIKRNKLEAPPTVFSPNLLQREATNSLADLRKR